MDPLYFQHACFFSLKPQSSPLWSPIGCSFLSFEFFSITGTTTGCVFIIVPVRIFFAAFCTYGCSEKGFDFKHPFERNKQHPSCPQLPLSICKWKLIIRDRLNSIMPGCTAERGFQCACVLLLQHVGVWCANTDIFGCTLTSLGWLASHRWDLFSVLTALWMYTHLKTSCASEF